MKKMINNDPKSPSEMYLDEVLNKWEEDMSTFGGAIDVLDMKPFINFINHFIELRREWASIQNEYDAGKLPEEAFKQRFDELISILLFYGRMLNHKLLLSFLKDQFKDSKEVVDTFELQLRETRLIWVSLNRPMYDDFKSFEELDKKDD